MRRILSGSTHYFSSFTTQTTNNNIFYYLRPPQQKPTILQHLKNPRWVILRRHSLQPSQVVRSIRRKRVLVSGRIVHEDERHTQSPAAQTAAATSDSWHSPPPWDPLIDHVDWDRLDGERLVRACSVVHCNSLFSPEGVDILVHTAVRQSWNSHRGNRAWLDHHQDSTTRCPGSASDSTRCRSSGPPQPSSRR